MQKRTREIIALVLLIVLGIAGISAMAWYILVGHNWNAAATNIDDRIGNMDGYTVILCEGASLNAGRPTELAMESSSVMSYIEDKSLDDGSAQARRLTLDEAIASYREKGAAVLKIHWDERSDYREPVITQKNGKRFAIYSVSGPRSDITARAMRFLLTRYRIDFAICLVDSVQVAEFGLGDANLAVCARGMRVNESEYVGKTYVVGAPAKGHVNAVIMSPSGFLTSKMLDVA